ncbi:TPA: DoxX family protein [Candidatus Latescibacteria bacterium]|nr:DoxX family protein [Candidatus Latescibacterota bacterium]
MSMGFLFGGSSIQGTAANIGLAILRIFSGLAMALAHGIEKVPPSERMITNLGNMGFPLPNLFAWAAGSAELFGGVFLAAGFMTRISAFFVSFTMVIAAFVAHAGDPFGRKEKALLFLCIGVMYLLVGAGKYSIDALIKKQDEIANQDSW